MNKEISVQLDEGFDLTPEKLPFYRQCIDWAQRLNRLSEGGVSIKFFGKGMMYPVATVWLKGHEVVRLYFENHSIYFTRSNIYFPNRKFFDSKEGDAWKVIFKPALKENIREMIQRAKEWEEKIDSHTVNRWNKSFKDD